MRRIQVDMFEVQLGASLLLQFHRRDGAVRVLADAGIKAGGYPVDHVHRKLPEAFETFGDSRRRIDLLIGTHYDEDHLTGLVPIAGDESLEIGEAWLPPVADDAQPASRSGPPGEADLLPLRLAGPHAAEVLEAHLRAKHQACRLLADLERDADAFRADRPRERRRALPDPGLPVQRGSSRAAWAQLFDAHVEDARVTLGAQLDDDSHAAALFPCESVPALRGEPDDADTRHRRWADDPVAAARDAIDLAAVRRAVARDAINAIALAEVVEALAARHIPIRCPSIRDGTPQHYRWDARSRQFVESRGPARGLGLTLLGPSEGLIRRHWARLPVAEYLPRARAAQIPILSITPSNQLSLVTRFHDGAHALLLSGDAGFVDFTDGDGGYHPDLIANLLPADVVQVAHHAGNNGHFYRALLDAGFASRGSDSLLLISHATRDRHRPSAAFDAFLQQCREGGGSPTLLFTSKPQSRWVRHYRDAAHPPIGRPHLVGDVRLAMTDDGWTVERHAVRV